MTSLVIGCGSGWKTKFGLILGNIVWVRDSHGREPVARQSVAISYTVLYLKYLLLGTREPHYFSMDSLCSSVRRLCT